MATKKKTENRGRPKTYRGNTLVRVAPDGSSKLQAESDRRAIVDYLIDCGGTATINDINAWFGYDHTPKVMALVRAGWLDTGVKK